MDLEFKDYINYKTYIIMDSEDYRFISDLSEGLFATKHNNEVCGYINEVGYEKLLFDYIIVGDFHEGFAIVQNKKGLYGFINKEFKEVIPCFYIFASNFVCGYAIVKGTSGDLVIDTNGEVVRKLEDADYENVCETLYKNKLISKRVYEEYLENDIKVECDIVKKTNAFPAANLKTYSYYNNDDQKVIFYSNMEDRDFCGNYVVLKVDRNDFRIFNKKGKQLKIHSYIDFDITSDLEKMEKMKQSKYRTSDTIEDGYVSTLKFQDIEYTVYAKDIIELNEKKIAVLNDIKSYLNNLNNVIETKIKSLTNIKQ